jgi:hypothetical protein
LCQDFSAHQPPPASGIFDVSFVYRWLCLWYSCFLK